VSGAPSTSSSSVLEAKRALFEACEGTFRGSAASASERAAVEEAQVALERLSDRDARRDVSQDEDDGEKSEKTMTNADGRPTTTIATALDLRLLSGKWRLAYTNAYDVLSVLRLARDSFGVLEVGDIYQSFDAFGKIENEIRFGVAFLTKRAALDTDGGVALKVGARYDVASSSGASIPGNDRSRTPRTLNLRFTEARFCDLRISDEFETLLAPALLPRTRLNHEALLTLRALDARFNLDAAAAFGGDGGDSGGAPVGSYRITYVDEDTLIGRANGAGGTFIFRRHGRAAF
jgi:hypothetical protein